MFLNGGAALFLRIEKKLPNFQIDSIYVAPLEETYLPNWLYFPNCSFQGETIQSDDKSTLKGRSWTNKPATLDFSQLVDILVIVKNMIYGFVSKSHIRSI